MPLSAPGKPLIKCLLSRQSLEGKILASAAESLADAGLSFRLTWADEMPIRAKGGAITVGHLKDLAAMAGGGLEPAALVAILPADPASFSAATAPILDDPALVATLASPLQVVRVRSGLRRAIRWVQLTADVSRLKEESAAMQQEMVDLQRAVADLAAAGDLRMLQQMLLSACRQFTGAQAGSLYLFDERQASPRLDGGVDARRAFVMHQNDTMPVMSGESHGILDPGSLAAQAAASGEVFNIDSAVDLDLAAIYGPDPIIETAARYRVMSLLLVPITGPAGDVTGVIELSNRVGDDQEIVAFDRRCVTTTLALAGNAAPHISNVRRRAGLEMLYEGLAGALVARLESDDHDTAHAARVASLSVALAEEINRDGRGSPEGLPFQPEEVRALKHAALLHGSLPGAGAQDQPQAHARRTSEFLRGLGWTGRAGRAAAVISICDRFDLLTCRDEVRREALRVNDALATMRCEAEKGDLDAEMLARFERARIHERTSTGVMARQVLDGSQ